MPDYVLPDRVLLDVTLRDGGYLNDHGWTLDQAVAIVRAVDAAGIPLAEVGYVTSGPHDETRPVATSPASYLDRLASEVTTTGLVLMAKPERISPRDVARLADHGVRMVRFPVPADNVGKALHHVEAARSAGMAVSLNIVRVSEQDPVLIAKRAAEAAGIGASILYLADSNGSMVPADVSRLFHTVRDHTDIRLGFHAHDNLRLAFGNTLAALDAGVTAVDASAFGIGKGGGNLRLELAVAHLATRAGMPLRMEPVLDLAAVVAAERVVLDAGLGDAIVTGMLDLNLDAMPEFAEQRRREGLDAVLARQAGAPMTATPA